MMGLPYMPFYVDDYYSDTVGLPALAHAGYLLLIIAYWKKGGPLPLEDKKLSRLAFMTDKEWLSVRADVVQFFTVDEGTLVHKRIERELALARDKIEKARLAGIASGVARANGR